MEHTLILKTFVFFLISLLVFNVLLRYLPEPYRVFNRTLGKIPSALWFSLCCTSAFLFIQYTFKDEDVNAILKQDQIMNVLAQKEPALYQKIQTELEDLFKHQNKINQEDLLLNSKTYVFQIARHRIEHASPKNTHAYTHNLIQFLKYVNQRNPQQCSQMYLKEDRETLLQHITAESEIYINDMLHELLSDNQIHDAVLNKEDYEQEFKDLYQYLEPQWGDAYREAAHNPEKREALFQDKLCAMMIDIFEYLNQADNIKRLNYMKTYLMAN